MSSNTVVLITGASRGIGKALVGKYLLRDNYTVIATVRDASDNNSKGLSTLSKGTGSKLIVASMDAADRANVKAVVNQVTSENSIDHLDIVIANAGVNLNAGLSLLEADAEALQAHVDVNAYGPVWLYQATAALLKKSTQTPKFVPISTMMASIGILQAGFANAMPTYAASKTYLNALVRSIALADPDVVIFPLHPGWVQTDMGNAGAKAGGLESAPTTTEDSVNGIVKVIDEATREKSDKFMTFEGKEIPW